MIIVEGARPREGERPQDWIDAAIGLPDENGNEFELITLRWTYGRNAPHGKTQGFEDTIISRKSGGGISIRYRKPGGVSWYPQLGGVYEGKLAKTPHNMEQLAATYYDGMYRIKDERLDAIVKARAEEIENSLSPEMKQFNAERRKDMHRSVWEKEEARSGDGMPEDHIIRDQEKHNTADRLALAKKRRELEEREQEILRQKRLLDEQQKALGVKAVKDGARIAGYQRGGLEDMHLSKIKGILRNEFNQEAPPTMKKTEAIELVLQLQSGKGTPQSETAPEPVAVTS